MNINEMSMCIESAYQIAGGDFPIHRLLFKRDFYNLVTFFKNGIFNEKNINEKDHRGNTPILLAGKLTQ